MKQKLIIPVFVSLMLIAFSISSSKAMYCESAPSPVLKQSSENSLGFYSFRDYVYLGKMTYDAGQGRILVIQAWADFYTGLIQTGMQCYINGSEGACLYDGTISVNASSVRFSDVTIHYFSNPGNGTFTVPDGHYDLQ